MKVKIFLLIVLNSFFNEIFGETRILKKRQIYREQVLPHAGGKIPESAFEVDRLALNRLQREGIAIPDGVVLEQRAHQVYQYPVRSIRPTFRIALTPSGRYTPKEGKYHPNEVPSIETTYLIPQISGHLLKGPPKYPFRPVYVAFRLPNPELKGHAKFQVQQPPRIQNNGPISI